MRRLLRFLGQEQLHQGEIAVIELGRGHGFAGHLDHRIIGRADRHRHRAQHAHAEAGRVVHLLQRIAVLQGVGEHRRTLVAAAVLGTNHVEADFQVGLAGLLEALVAADQLRIVAGDDVALAEQGTPRGLTGGGIAHRVIARKRAGIIEAFVLVDGGLVRRTAGTADSSNTPAVGAQMK